MDTSLAFYYTYFKLSIHQVAGEYPRSFTLQWSSFDSRFNNSSVRCCRLLWRLSVSGQHSHTGAAERLTLSIQQLAEGPNIHPAALLVCRWLIHADVGRPDPGPHGRTQHSNGNMSMPGTDQYSPFISCVTVTDCLTRLVQIPLVDHLVKYCNICILGLCYSQTKSDLC